MLGDAAGLNTALLTLLTAGVAAGTAALGFIMRQLAFIREQTTKTNGRVTSLETWKEGHERWQTERNATNEREHGQLHERIAVTSKAVQDVRADTFNMRIHQLREARESEKE